MSSNFKIDDQTLTWRGGKEILVLTPWGPDGIRVRSTRLGKLVERPTALLQPPPPAQAKVEVFEHGATLTCGKTLALVTNSGQLRFFNAETGALLLEEEAPHFTLPPARTWQHRAGDTYRLDVRFRPQPDEKFYGLGQHKNGKLDQKGCMIELEQRNSEVCIPFMISSRGYAFLWNDLSLGKIDLSHNLTLWTAEATRQMDYYVTAGESYAELLQRYHTLTGLPTLLPEWALGFWQCKLRYRTQQEILEIAREYKKRGIPLSVLVIDFFHWTRQGDWQFNPSEFPDPASMVKELKEMGIELMVSIWPTVNHNSPNYEPMRRAGMLIGTEHGADNHKVWVDIMPEGAVPLTFYDASNPEARRYVWEQVRKNYYRYGIRVFWLDADEPEVYPHQHENLRYDIGNGEEVALIYPLLHQQGFYEGLRSEGEKEIVTLSRSGYLGSARYGAAIWSGDIASTFPSLRLQVRAGLNMALSGIPWWTTDIGGFYGGDVRTPEFRELLVRWFQYGAFCPLFRLHGVREPAGDFKDGSGAPNEVWSYGEETYAILRQLIFIREKLRPYLQAQNLKAHRDGTPVMRPLLYDYQGDAEAEGVDDAFMLGPDLLVAPILYEGATSRQVYLPAGCEWIDAWTGVEHTGGKSIQADAPLNRIPVFWKKGSSWTFRFDEVQ
ncbi:MAG TPA: TIM-barrel domain-containing protein [Anaerolineaceae bacterium]